MNKLPDCLAYWYLRLNGFLTIENFVVHPDTGRNQRTDADLLAVRFAHRAELQPKPMPDDKKLLVAGPLVNVIIAEVKTSACALNGPWTDPNKQNIQRVLRAIGCFPREEVNQAAAALYDLGAYYSPHAAVRLFAFGDAKGEIALPVPQVLFDDMIQFIWKRLDEYQQQKSSVGNWAEDGLAMHRAFDESRTPDEFRPKIRALFGLRSVA